jgi:hypothetical protein
MRTCKTSLLEVRETPCINQDWIKMEDFVSGTRWLFRIESGIVNIDGLDLTLYRKRED